MEGRRIPPAGWGRGLGVVVGNSPETDDDFFYSGKTKLCTHRFSFPIGGRIAAERKTAKNRSSVAGIAVDIRRQPQPAGHLSLEAFGEAVHFSCVFTDDHMLPGILKLQGTGAGVFPSSLGHGLVQFPVDLQFYLINTPDALCILVLLGQTDSKGADFFGIQCVMQRVALLVVQSGGLKQEGELFPDDFQTG